LNRRREETRRNPGLAPAFSDPRRDHSDPDARSPARPAVATSVTNFPIGPAVS
jgi:hypothetical protein